VVVEIQADQEQEALGVLAVAVLVEAEQLEQQVQLTLGVVLVDQLTQVQEVFLEQPVVQELY
jgi:hypothetical protein